MLIKENPGNCKDRHLMMKRTCISSSTKFQYMPSPNYNYDKKRFETFIDAVIAIILTILVLELRLPEGGHTEGLTTKQQLTTLLPSFISYIGSFLLIAGIWIDHHLLFLNVERLTK